MRIIFMGNPDFAVPSLQCIANSVHQIIAVVSNPPKKIGRGNRIQDTAVGLFAKGIGLPVVQPPKINDINFLRYIAAMQPDIFVVVAYQILPDSLLSIPKFGSINLHPSLLPKYRGAAPIQWALINGDSQTAVTTISLSKRIDSGAVLMQKSVDVKSEDNHGSLSNRLSKIGADLVVETLDGIESGTIQGSKQDEKLVTLAPKIKSADLNIDWLKSAEEIHNRIRAFSPSPGAFTTFQNKRLKIFSSELSNFSSDNGPGEIVLCNNGELSIQTGNKVLNILEVQLEGKKRLTVTEFLRGTNLEPKIKFGA